MRGLNLSKFKKMKEDNHSAILVHKDGHQLMIAKAPLSHLQRKQLEQLEMHSYAEGGKIQQYAEGTGDAHESKAIPINLNSPNIDNVPINNQSDISYDSLISKEQANNAPYGTGKTPATPDSTVDTISTSQAEPQSSSAAIPMSSQGSLQNVTQAQIPGFEEEKQANLANAQAQAQQGIDESRALRQASNQIQNLPTQSDIIARNQEASNKLFDSYKNKELDPDNYWTNHSKIAAGIGILLSSAGQAAGGRNGNGALEAIHEGIDRDIESQKNNIQQKQNLWHMNRAALGSDIAANLATQNQLYTGLKYKIEQAASQAKGPLALANAQLFNAKIDQAIGTNNYKLSLLNPTSDNPDPASRVQFLVPQERQQKVIDEINAAKNTVSNAPGILQAFDQASREVRPLTGGVHTSGTAFVPGIKSPGQSALQARLGPTFQDVEGTVRQAAMDNLDHNITPKFGDDDSTIATKKASLLDYLKSKSAASASKSFGIDLAKYPSTNTVAIGGQHSGMAPGSAFAMRNGVQYQKQTINGKNYYVPVPQVASK